MFFVTETIFALLKGTALRRICFAVATVALGWLPSLAVAGSVGIVQVPRLNLRPAPNTDGAPVAVLKKGTEVRVLERRAGWMEITVGRRRGFVRDRAHYVRITASTDEGPATPTQSQMSRAKTQAADIAARIAGSQKDVSAYTAQEEKVIADLDGIERAVSQKRQQVNATRRDMAALDERMDKIRGRIARLQADIDRRRGTATKRLVAYYKLSWVGRLQLLATAETVQDLFFRERALSTILDADGKRLRRLTQDRDRMDHENQQLATAKRQKAALAPAYSEQLKTLASEKQRRERLLGDIRNKKALELAAIAALEQAARDLDSALVTLSREVVREAATPPATPEAPIKPTPAPRPFSRLKGLLPIPVEGNIVSRFGEYRDSRHNVLKFRSGVDIRADFGEPVHAVSAGKVLYADWFKGFGNMLIIDHDDHYYTVYAHLEETFKQKGDPVDAGEVIATVGDTGSFAGPKLYFEVRHHGKPMDPATWIKQG